jgi:LPS-assembly protein
VRYTNECVSVDLSLSRRFTSSTNVRPDTGIGLSVELAGFGGTSGTANRRSVCAR